MRFSEGLLRISLIELSGRLSKTSNSCPFSKNRGNHNRVIEIHKILLFFSMLVDSIKNSNGCIEISIIINPSKIFDSKSLIMTKITSNILY